MKIETRQQLISAYIEFFKKNGHKHIPSASLIPENDPTVLFTTAGMHPLVPFLLGQKHPLGKRLVDVQKCIRTVDIDEVGNTTHHTFFEMLGNWSLGDYFKEEAIKLTFEFHTKVLGIPVEKYAVSVFEGDKDAKKDDESAKIWQSLGVSKDRIAFLPKSDNWWGPAGESGPCGPCTEQFYWKSNKPVPKKFNPEDKGWVEIGNDVLMEFEKKQIKVILTDAINALIDKSGKLNKELAEILQNTGKKIVVVTNAEISEIKSKLGNYNFEIFSLLRNPEKSNSKYFKVLLEKYNLKPEEVIYFDHKEENIKSAKENTINCVKYKDNNQIKTFIEANMHKFVPLQQKNIDFGGGVERALAILNGLDDNYQTSIFKPIIEEIEKLSNKTYGKDKEETRAMRIIADHIRAATFILGDYRAVKPSNVGQGYVLRRLIRRAIRYGKQLGIKDNFTSKIAKTVLPIYPDYQELHQNHKFIQEQLDDEETKFNATLEKGIKEFNKMSSKPLITGKEAFLLFQSYGFPIEFTEELADERGIIVDLEEYNQEFKKHQDLSRTSSSGMFKSGLADDSEATKKLHTATHLLNEALRRVLNDKAIAQKGSNINPERLRFDFNFPRKLTPQEISDVESLVNQKIKDGLKIIKEEIPLQDAIKSGAQSEFGAKYPELVSVYTIIDKKEPKGFFSKEICTGPHVSNTSELGSFKIQKEESVAAGIRRIKAVVE
jgi:alanyl-tRNA synthetase